MKQEFATFKNKQLLLHVPENRQEMEIGYKDIQIVDGEGMLFVIDQLALIPISVGTPGKELDVLWFKNGIVHTMAVNLGGVIIAEGNAVLELPLGWAVSNKVKLGDRLLLHGMGKSKVSQ